MRSRSSVFLLALTLTACHAMPRPAAAPAPPPLSATAQLQREIDAMLAVPELARSYWGVLVKSLRTDETLYTLNAGRLLLPGSTLKVATLATVADRLGWDYTYQTRVVATVPIQGGVLNGDLLVVGSGDPSIVDGARVFDRWAETLSAAGIRTIAGRIIGDDNAFDDEAVGPGWTWEDLADRDGAPIGGLQFNENVAMVSVAPGPEAGMSAIVGVTPSGHGFVVDNHVTTVPAGGESGVRVRRPAGSNRLELSGTMALGATPVLRNAAVENPTLFFVSALRATLQAHGIDVRGPAVDIDDISDPPAAALATTLVTYTSPPLSTLAIRLMKNSQNLYAETLLKTMGARSGSSSWESSLREERTVLAEWGVPSAGLVQVDGSGLSRYNYITPDTLVTILTHVDRDPRLRDPFEAALPIAGRDGTLAARMRGTPAENNARAKSGTLANARSLAGYVTDADGDRLVFAVIANNYGTTADPAIAAMDRLIGRLAQFSSKSAP